MANSASLSVRILKLSRKLHLYVGLFIAPALLFFASTGAVQTLSLHEAAGTSYQPPAWLAEMGFVHKYQATKLPGSDDPPPPPAPEAAAPRPKPARPPETLASKEHQHLPLKVFFVVVSLGLCLSTFTGIFMAYKYERNKLLVTAWLIAGTVVPLLLLRF